MSTPRRSPAVRLTAGLCAATLCAGAATVAAGATATATATVAEEVTCEGQVATIVGTSGDDHLRGTPGKDVIVALQGDDRVEARHGQDLVCAGAGDDEVLGGRAGDRIVGGGGDDTIEPEQNDDVVIWRPGHGLDVVLSQWRDADVVELHGTSGDDELTVRRGDRVGRHQSTALLTPEANGVLVARGRHARLSALLGDGADRVTVRTPRHGALGRVLVYGGPVTQEGRPTADGAADVLHWRGSDGPDSAFITRQDATSVHAAVTASRYQTGVSMLAGDPGDRFLVDGGDGRDFVQYSAPEGPNEVAIGAARAADTLLVEDVVGGSPALQLLLDFERLSVLVGSGADVVDLRGMPRSVPARIFGGAGGDTMYGSPGRNLFRANRGDDTAYGGPGRDRLEGGDRDDRLFGGRGDDVLDGSAFLEDLDECTGGPGRDTFIECETETRDAADTVAEGRS